ncbi:hypothetical protein I7G59_09675 [Sinorhizobium meliloti]|uniref:hypothetical protein n=1 Tax=Rhizobium meliloti TaxID=382 RepID=UPI00237FE879|nr:hypothetical protein [Sinorhizobium meliloti]MDE3797595.1 hypothetical protein [Sinorhizobium meliloti]
MTKDFTGEVTFEALGKTWTLKMGTKAMRKIEVVTEKPMPVVGKMLTSEETASIDLMTKVFWGGLITHHPDVTVDDCDDIMDAVGHTRAGQLIGEAFEAAQAPQSGGAERPRKATAG